MSEETQNTVEQSAQTTEADSNVDYKALYHQEVKNSKSQRSKKQELESKMDKLELKSEEDRQAKMIAEGKKDELLQEQSARIKEMEKELGTFKQVEETQKAKLLEEIPEEDRVHYESMNLQQLEHFVKQTQSPDVSNPSQAVQGRSNVNFDMDSFMKQPESARRENFKEIIKTYENKAGSTKQKVNKHGNTNWRCF